ncbi:MAG TPA: class I SAM-dependent methyltransferase [Burkholderiaceae bacterium]|nr:class I SAM-dependent methyltransferase [Burkholderiaceae bacterium]
MRDFVRNALPRWALHRYRIWNARRQARAFGQLSPAAAFDKIYLEERWGSAGQPSGSGSYGIWAHEYVAYVKELAAEKGLKTAVDIGCGDFNIGSQLAGSFDRYDAVDVSPVIIARNTTRFSHLVNVHFRALDATRDALPVADLVMVRQVLQHLTNAQIEALLRNVEASRPKVVVVAEHGLPNGVAAGFNVDLEGHSPGTRLVNHSCVRIDRPPFSRSAGVVREIPVDRPVLEGVPEHLAIFLWVPAGEARGPG